MVECTMLYASVSLSLCLFISASGKIVLFIYYVRQWTQAGIEWKCIKNRAEIFVFMSTQQAHGRIPYLKPTQHLRYDSEHRVYREIAQI